MKDSAMSNAPKKLTTHASTFRWYHSWVTILSPFVIVILFGMMAIAIKP